MISVEDKSGARVITFSRPEKHNAIGVADYLLLAEVFHDTNKTGEISSVQILGEGKTFCAGNNLAEFETEWPQPEYGPVYQFLNAISATDVPIIAGVQGGAVGIGATMLLHCDVVLMTPGAWLSYPFVPLGVAPEGGSSYLLPARLGYARAMDLLISGRRVQAEEAIELGLGTSLVCEDALMTEVQGWSGRIASLSRDAVIETKRLIRQGIAPEITTLFETEIQAVNRLLVNKRQEL